MSSNETPAQLGHNSYMGQLEDFQPVGRPKLLDAAHLLPAQSELVHGASSLSRTTVQQREEAFFGRSDAFSFSQFGNIYGSSDVLAYGPEERIVKHSPDAIDKQIDATFRNYGASSEFGSSILHELHRLPENLQDTIVKGEPPYCVSVAKDADSFLKQNPDIAKGLTEGERQAIRHVGAFRDSHTHRLVFFENYLEGHANIPTRFVDTHNMRGAVAHEIEHVNDEQHKYISQTDKQFETLYEIGSNRLLADSKHPYLMGYFVANDPPGYGQSETFAELSALKATGETSRKDYTATQLKHYFKELDQYVEQQIDAGQW